MGTRRRGDRRHAPQALEWTAADAWLGSVAGHRTRALGVEHFGQTGTIGDLYRHYGIDADAIMAAAQAMAPGRPLRHFRLIG